MNFIRYPKGAPDAETCEKLQVHVVYSE